MQACQHMENSTPGPDELWEVYRCDRAEPDRACGVKRVGGDRLDGVVVDTNREECQHGVKLADAERVVWLNNREVRDAKRVAYVDASLEAWRKWAAGVTKREAPDDFQRRTIASVIEAPAVIEVPGDADASTDLSDADLVFLTKYVATPGDGGFVKPLVREIQRRRAREVARTLSVDDLVVEACARVAYDASRAPRLWDDCSDGAKALHRERVRSLLITRTGFAGQPVFNAAVRAVARALDDLEVATAPLAKIVANGAVDLEAFAKFRRDHAAATGYSPQKMAIVDADPAPVSRDHRQSRIVAWAKECFGIAKTSSPSHRAARMLEEAFKLAQALGVSRGVVDSIASSVFGRLAAKNPDPAQEIGGLSITLLLLAASVGVSADAQERLEIERVLALPPAHFAERDRQKVFDGRRVEPAQTMNVDVAPKVQTRRSATAGTLDQPPPIPQPFRIPVWENVIFDFRNRFSDNFDGIVDDDAHKYVGDRVLADMRDRDRVGRARYGTPLTTGNGRDHLVDAYQELLDAAVYLRAAHLDGAQVLDEYNATLDAVMSVRKTLDARAVAE